MEKENSAQSLTLLSLTLGILSLFDRFDSVHWLLCKQNSPAFPTSSAFLGSNKSSL